MPTSERVETKATSTRARGWRAVAMTLGLAILAVGVIVALVLWSQPAADPDRIWAAAEESFRSGREDEARAMLERLARLRKPNELDRMLRAQLHMARNELEPAVADLNSIPDGHALAAQARLLAGQIELRRERLRPAEAYLRKAIALDPAIASARKELIYIIGMQMRRKDLLEQFRELSRVMPLDYDQVLLWCLARSSIWDARQHSNDLRRYFDADPDDLTTRLALVDLYIQGGFPARAVELLERAPNENPDARAARARIALDAGQVDVAKKLLAGGPIQHAALARLRGKLALSERDAQTALHAFQIAYAIEPEDRDTIFGIGHAYRAMNDESRAAPFLKAAKDQDRFAGLLKTALSGSGRADPKMPLALALECEKIGRPREGEAWCKVEISRDPLSDEAQRILFRLQKTPEPKSEIFAENAVANGVAGPTSPR
jgi:tetratricopeptide (TPR) repeat protein